MDNNINEDFYVSLPETGYIIPKDANKFLLEFAKNPLQKLKELGIEPKSVGINFPYEDK